jgi:hypothetical protein
MRHRFCPACDESQHAISFDDILRSFGERIECKKCPEVRDDDTWEERTYILAREISRILEIMQEDQK